MKENVSVVSYILGNKIRNKIVNYKETVNSVFIDEEVSFSNDTGECLCANSTFCDPNHHHIITGDLRIIENAKLRKLLIKGPNYRKPVSINYKHCTQTIENALSNCIEAMS